jgi:peptidoglycan hydrolase-like protein with peptidoglycan-binding domain
VSRRVLLVLGVTGTVLAAGVAAAAGLGFLGTGQAASAPESTPPRTAEVTRQTLVDTETRDGELGFGATTSVRTRLSGTVTALTAVGTTVQRGQELYRVDDAPVVLLYGSLPAYRTLAAGVEGPDVEQFERNLADLGYGGFTVDEQFSAATATAVEDWQEDLGLDESGAVDLGRVVYAGDAVRVAEHGVAAGDAATPNEEILTYTGTTRVITVELEVADQRLAVRDAAVTVTLPDDRTTAGRIAGSATVIQTSDSGDGGAGPDDSSIETTVEVTVAVDDQQALSGLDEASARVAFTAGTREDVLTVPVAALLALAEGGYGLQVVDGDHSRVVAVTTGMFAGGRVEVTGDGLTAGTTVGVPE